MPDTSERRGLTQKRLGNKVEQTTLHTSSSVIAYMATPIAVKSAARFCVSELDINMGGWNKKQISLKQHLVDNIEIITESGCWIWKLGVDSKGYGIVNIPGKRKTIRAHRASYHEFKGNISDGLHVLHSCDITCCCNPSHLRLGTNKENMQDKCSKGRHRNKYTGKLSA